MLKSRVAKEAVVFAKLIINLEPSMSTRFAMILVISFLYSRNTNNLLALMIVKPSFMQLLYSVSVIISISEVPVSNITYIGVAATTVPTQKYIQSLLASLKYYHLLTSCILTLSPKTCKAKPILHRRKSLNPFLTVQIYLVKSTTLHNYLQILTNPLKRRYYPYWLLPICCIIVCNCITTAHILLLY